MFTRFDEGALKAGCKAFNQTSFANSDLGRLIGRDLCKIVHADAFLEHKSLISIHQRKYASVLKTSEGKNFRGFESHPLRHLDEVSVFIKLGIQMNWSLC